MIKCSLDMILSWENKVSVKADAGFVSPREAGTVSLAGIGVKRSGYG